jgi:erythritol transport system ATP-binding protein
VDGNGGDALLAREVTQRGVVIDRKTQRQNTRELVRRLEQDIDPDTLVADLRIGQQQIIEIARALAVDPKFVLLDEPFAGVDPIAVEEIQTIVAKLKNKNITFLVRS